MRLKVMTPIRIVADEAARKITAEAANGSFCLLPRHIDFLAALVPGILFFENHDGEEVFLAVDGGLLVKCGEEVSVSTRLAVRGRDLETLRQTLDEQMLQQDERERRTRTVLARLETSFARRFMEMEKNASG
jgi:F-type H+-transporting ATPase subunit epsilon